MTEAVLDAGYCIIRFAFGKLYRSRRLVKSTQSVDSGNLQQFLGVGLFASDSRDFRDSWNSNSKLIIVISQSQL